MGRKRLEIDKGQVYKLASMGLSYKEIGEVMGCCTKTLQRNFVQLIEKGHHNMRASLTRTQFMMAMGADAKYDDETGKELQPARAPNITMLIWLGKNKLGQSDRLSTEDRTPGGSELRQSKDRVAKIMGDSEARDLYNRLCDRLGVMDGEAEATPVGEGRVGGNGEDTED